MSHDAVRAALGRVLCLVPVGVLLAAVAPDARGIVLVGDDWLWTWGWAAGVVALLVGAALPGRSKPLIWAGGACATIQVAGLTLMMTMLTSADWPDLLPWVLSLGTWSLVSSVSVGCLSCGALWLDPACFVSVLGAG